MNDCDCTPMPNMFGELTHSFRCASKKPPMPTQTDKDRADIERVAEALFTRTGYDSELDAYYGPTEEEAFNMAESFIAERNKRRGGGEGE